MSLAKFPNGEWYNPNLFRKVTGDREIAVVLDQHAAENEHGIGRRRNLCHPRRYRSFPAGASDEVVAGFGSRGAFANVGKISVVRRISELYAVVASSHVRNMQDLRSFPEIPPADRSERVAVHAGSPQF